MVQQRGLHKAWLERDAPITHITFNPKKPSHILLHDLYMFCVLDKSLVRPCAWIRGVGLCLGHLPCPIWVSQFSLGVVMVQAVLIGVMDSPHSPCQKIVPS